MICVISQPTFLPWLGWFDLADQSDVTVILDDVQFAKRSWQQRNRIKTKNGLDFLTVPVNSSGLYKQRIMDCQLADKSFIEKMVKTLQANYAKAPFFKDTIEEFISLTNKVVATGRLVELNCELISWLAMKLNVTVPIVRASELGTGGQRGEHLAEICKQLGADQYLSTTGSEEYLLQDKVVFDERNIVVNLHVYEHPVYSQQYPPFIPYASALDLIFNAGPAAPEVMRSGRRPSRLLGEECGKH